MTDLSLIFANLFSRKLRAILMIVAIFFAFFIFGVLSGVQHGFSSAGGKAAEARLVTLNKINFTQPLPISYVERVRGIDGVALVSYANWFGGYFQKPENFMVAFGVEPETYLAVYRQDIKITDAERATFLADKGSMLVGYKIAEQYGWKVGDRVPLNSNIFFNKSTGGGRTWDFTVAGIIFPATEEADSNFVMFHDSYFSETRTFGRDSAGWLIIETVDPKRNAEIGQKIDEMFANSPAETATDTEKAFNQAFLGQIGDIALIITLVVGASFFTILMIVGNTMVMAVRERTKEIGVMKTLGFPSPRIFRMVLGESILLALLGGVPALLAASGILILMKSAVGFPGLALTPVMAAIGVGLMLALGLITGFIPAWNALRLNIVTALGRQ